MKRDFLTLSDLSKDERSALIHRARLLKDATVETQPRGLLRCLHRTVVIPDGVAQGERRRPEVSTVQARGCKGHALTRDPWPFVCLACLRIMPGECDEPVTTTGAAVLVSGPGFRSSSDR